MLKTHAFVFAVCMLGLCKPLSATESRPPANVYVTWKGAEPDKGASAWYLQRFVDPMATFDVREPGSPVDGGIAFDVPQAKYRRTHNASTLETILRDHPSRDPAVLKLAQLTHDLEINLWRPKVLPETALIEEQMRAIADGFNGKIIPMECFLSYFESVYLWLQAQSQGDIGVPAVCSGE